MTQAVVGGTTTAYTYNGDGARTKKQITGGATTDYYQDINGKLPLVAAEKVGSDWTYYVYGKTLIAKREANGAPKYYHYDASGNVRAITDSTGAVVERYDYDAFGGLRSTAPTGTPANDRRFSGEQNDAETGYVFLRARYYDPAIGRFISKDPARGTASRPQSLNKFSYTENNPVGFADPSGRSLANPPDAPSSIVDPIPPVPDPAHPSWDPPQDEPADAESPADSGDSGDAGDTGTSGDSTGPNWGNVAGGAALVGVGVGTVALAGVVFAILTPELGVGIGLGAGFIAFDHVVAAGLIAFPGVVAGLAGAQTIGREVSGNEDFTLIGAPPQHDR